MNTTNTTTPTPHRKGRTPMRPTTPAPLTALELFAGAGGLAAAVKNTLGADTVAYSEIEPHLDPVLRALFPGVSNAGDVTTLNTAQLPPIDVVAGGSPCTDISVLGRRAGMGPDTRSGLWAAMCRIITDTAPRFVVWENVRGALTTRTAAGNDMRALGRVLADLHTLGYDAQWRTVKASDIGAPHQRTRVFLLAHLRWGAPLFDTPEPAFAYYDTTGDAWTGEHGPFTAAWPADGSMVGGYVRTAPAVPAPWPSLPTLRTVVAAEAGGGPLSETAAAHRGQTLRLTGQILSLFRPGLLPEAPGADPRPAPGWHEYAPAVHRWEGITGRPHPAPLVEVGNRPKLNPAFGEWLFGLDAGHITDPAHGLTIRQQITAVGNLAMPGQGEHALRHMHANLTAGRLNAAAA